MGSIHNWFDLAINLCSGIIVVGYFDNQETLKGYYTVYKQILENYGIPICFKTDMSSTEYYNALKKLGYNYEKYNKFRNK